MAELEIRTQVEEGVSEVWLRGELDAYSAPRVRELLQTLILGEQPSVVVDLAGLDYIDSSGLGVLVSALRQARDNGGQITLAHPSPVVARVLQITGLHRVFPVVSDTTGTSDTAVTSP